MGIFVNPVSKSGFCFKKHFCPKRGGELEMGGAWEAIDRQLNEERGYSGGGSGSYPWILQLAVARAHELFVLSA
jgi:hypothetical protein